MKTEKVFGGIILAALFFKCMHWPFSGPLLVIGLGTLAMIYFGGSFYFFSDKKIETQNIPLSIISGIALSIAIIGVLFKLMFWPFGEIYLQFGIAIIPGLLAATLVLNKKSQTSVLDTYYRNMIIRLSVMTAFVAVFYFTPSATLVRIIHSDDQEWVRLQTRHIENPENEEYSREYNDYVKSKHLKRNAAEEGQNK